MEQRQEKETVVRMVMDIATESKKNPELLCYRCGSFSIVLLNQQDGKRVFKCQSCGKVWIKRDVNGYENK